MVGQLCLEDFLDEAQRQAKARHRAEGMSEVCLKEGLGCMQDKGTSSLKMYVNGVLASYIMYK